MTISELKKVSEELVAEVNVYEAKPTKACSKRIRVALGAIKKHTTELRRQLVDADKKGY
jgi:hypothetical protein